MDITYFQRDALRAARYAHWLKLLFNWKPFNIVHYKWCHYLCHNSLLQERLVDALHWTTINVNAIRLRALDPTF